MVIFGHYGSAVVTVVACRTAMRRVRGSSLMPGCPLLGSPSLNGYWSMTGKPNTAEKGTGHPTSLSRWPSIMGVAMCPSATLKLACHLGLFACYSYYIFVCLLVIVIIFLFVVMVIIFLFVCCYGYYIFVCLLVIVIIFLFVCLL